MSDIQQLPPQNVPMHVYDRNADGSNDGQPSGVAGQAVGNHQQGSAWWCLLGAGHISFVTGGFVVRNLIDLSPSDVPIYP